MEKIFFILILVLCSVRLFADDNDTCDVSGTLTGNVTTVGFAGSVTGILGGKVVATTGIDTFSVNVTGSVTGFFVGKVTGVLNFVTTIEGQNTTFTATFLGVAIGIPGDADDRYEGEDTVDVVGSVSGNIICDELQETKSCAEDLRCDTNNVYSIMLCGYVESVGKKAIIVNCIKNLDEIPPGMRPNILPPSEMPICVDLDFSTYDNYGLPWNTITEEGTKKDVEDALNEWNCLCGYSKDDCKKIVKAHFSGPIDRNFPWIQDTIVLAYTEIDYDFDDCSMGVGNNPIVFNNTLAFRYDGVGPGLPIFHFVNKTDVPMLVPIGHNYFSFYDVMLHELGHVFGFIDSYLDSCPNRQSIMNGLTVANKPSQGLTDYDKCMFMTFYCGDSVKYISIEHIPLSQRPYINVVPNPTTGEINITFEVKDRTKPVTIGLYDEQGRTLKTLLSETIYSEGLHICSSRLDFLPTGMYFLRIEIGNISYFEKIIIVR